MKAIKIINLNGDRNFLVKEYIGIKGDFLQCTSRKIITTVDRVMLSYIPSNERNKPKFSFLESNEALQYDGARSSVNEDGYATVGFVDNLLKRVMGGKYNRDYFPYGLVDMAHPITYGELGYLLTYACRDEGGFPKLGIHKPSDSRMKVSVISVESEGRKTPEFRLGQYSSDRVFESYRQDIRSGSRPVPLPLLYGFMEYFSDVEGVTLLGQVPRGKVVELVESLV